MSMASLSAEKSLEEGLNLIRRAKLQDDIRVQEMYFALQKQYQQVQTIRLEHKPNDFVSQVSQDSNFFCILTKLLSQAVLQSRNKKQQNASMARVHMWYKSNVHKLNFAERASLIVPRQEVSLNKKEEALCDDEMEEKASNEDNDTSSQMDNQETLKTLPPTPARLLRPKSVTFERTDVNSTSPLVQDKQEFTAESVDHATSLPHSPLHEDALHPSGDSDLDDLAIDRINQINKSGAVKPTQDSTFNQATFALIHKNYIHQIQQEVNKVQGHPSDVYPELFTRSLITSLIRESSESDPPVLKHSSSLITMDTENFLKAANRYSPRQEHKFSALQPRKDANRRPKTSSNDSRTTKGRKESLQMKDIIDLADLASAEIVYEKDAGVRRLIGRPQTAPSALLRVNSQAGQEMMPANCQPEAKLNAVAMIPVRVKSASQTRTRNVVDWRGTVTPTIETSNVQSYGTIVVRHSASLPSKTGRSAGSTKAGGRPKTAPVDYHQKWKIDKPTDGSERVQHGQRPEVSQEATASMLNITNLRVSKGKRTASRSAPLNGREYLDYLTDSYSVPPSSIYEYPAYDYSDVQPDSRAFSFKEDELEPSNTSSAPKEYMSFVNSLAPAVDRVRGNAGPTGVMLGASSAGAGTAKANTLASNSSGYADIKDRNMLVDHPHQKTSAASGLTRVPGHQSQSSELASCPQKEITPSGHPFSAIIFDPLNQREVAGSQRGPSAAVPHRVISADDKHPRKVQPLRTPPSIPSVYGAFGGRSYSLNKAIQFSAEHEQSAHHQQNPSEYLNKVNTMRTELVTLPAAMEDLESLASILNIVPIATRPCLEYHPAFKHPEELESVGQEVGTEVFLTKVDFNSSTIQIADDARSSSSPSKLVTVGRGSLKENPLTTSSLWKEAEAATPDGSFLERKSRNPFVQAGRPIPQYMKADPWEKTEYEVMRQKEAAAAVNIQRIFRGYVARNVYLKLKRSYREAMEIRQKAAIQIQRSYRDHLARKHAIYTRPRIPDEVVQWESDYMAQRERADVKRNEKRVETANLNRRNTAELTERLLLVGPHVEIHQAYNQPKTGPTAKEINDAAVMIQKHVRGMQLRKYLAAIKEKAKAHAPTWKDWIRYYKQFLRSVLLRRGIMKPQITISLTQIDKFMAQKRRYENVFERRAFGNELEEEELMQFFKECDLLPAADEVQHALDLVFKGKPRRNKASLKKKDVLDVVFEIYKPEGTGLANDRKSTWLHPIVDGEDAMKLLGSDLVEPAPLGPCIKLVMDSMRERNAAATEALRRQLLDKSVVVEDSLDKK